VPGPEILAAGFEDFAIAFGAAVVYRALHKTVPVAPAVVPGGAASAETAVPAAIAASAFEKVVAVVVAAALGEN